MKLPLSTPNVPLELICTSPDAPDALLLVVALMTVLVVVVDILMLFPATRFFHVGTPPFDENIWESEGVVVVAVPPFPTGSGEFMVAKFPKPRFVRIVLATPSERLFATLNQVDEGSNEESPNPKFVRAVEVFVNSDKLFPGLSHVELGNETVPKFTQGSADDATCSLPYEVKMWLTW